MKPYEKPLSPQEYLMHYGVKGMKWGVRRYQNYDGSYTRKGLERYRKAESDYETAKSKADETRAAYKSGQATRQQVKDAKSAVKTEKRKMENAYEKLKTDKLADEGKKLYQSGKTISGNTQATYLAEGVMVTTYAPFHTLDAVVHQVFLGRKRFVVRTHTFPPSLSGRSTLSAVCSPCSSLPPVNH